MKKDRASPLGSVTRLNDGRYRVEKRDTAGISLELYEWQEALDEMKRQEMFRRITTGRQSARSTGGT